MILLLLLFFLSILLLLTALSEPSDSPLLSAPVRIAIFGTVFVLVVFVFLAKVIKRKRCTQQETRGTNFAYFVHSTILRLTTATPWNACFFCGYFCFLFYSHSTMFAKDTAAGQGGVNTQNLRFTV